MYYRLFRWFPKSAFSRLMGRLAEVHWPGWLLRPVLRAYVAAFRVDMREAAAPLAAYPTFNAFFTRALVPGARPIAEAPDALVCPVDGTAGQSGTIAAGRLLQAKGIDYALADLLGGDAGWQAYEGGHFLNLYLSPRDYHRIHSPAAGHVVRWAYVPGELWTVSRAGVEGVPGLFARNERLVTFIAAVFGELALVAVGATVVGRIKVVYHDVTSNRRGARARGASLATPYPVEKGGEVGRFELGSSVILLVRPGEATLTPPPPGTPVRLGQPIGRMVRAT